MKAFNNDPELKQQLIDMAAQHRKADEYLKGTYGDTEDGKFRACSIGCTIHDVNIIHGKNLSTDSHTALAKELDIPEFIFKLQDSIFEELPEPLSIEWTERLFNAIPLGKDLTPVLPRFLIKTLDRLPEIGRADVVAAIKKVRGVLHGWADKGSVDVAAARSAAWAAEAAKAAAWEARSAAWSAVEAAAKAAVEAAEAAARSAVEAAKARSAEAAARSSAWAVRSAAWAAEAAARSSAWEARSAVWSAEAAEAAAWEQIADDLIECIGDLAH